MMYPPKPEPYYGAPPTVPTYPYYGGPPPSTGVPVTAPPGAFQVQAHQPMVGRWSTGLCDCCANPRNCTCCITCLCPCITFGQIAEIIDRGSTSCGASGALYALLMFLPGCSCWYSCCYRGKLRAQFGLREAPCNDCLVHCCCECCSLCQMYRELSRRGFDMSIGWHANMERQSHMATMPPPPQAMAR